MLVMCVQFGTFETGQNKMWHLLFVLLVLFFAEFGDVSVDCDEAVYFLYIGYVGYVDHGGYVGYVDDARVVGIGCIVLVLRRSWWPC
jgi:hypothetical protein